MNPRTIEPIRRSLALPPVETRARHKLVALVAASVLVGASAAQQSEVAKLTASDGFPGNAFGRAVSVSDDTAIVGTGYSSGAAAYVYTRSAGVWTEQQKLTSGVLLDEFGVAVSASGDSVVVGAPSDGDGAAHVFVRSGGTWALQRKLFVSGSWRFGASVSLSGDTAIIGAPNARGLADFSGAAHVFVRVGGAWMQQQRLIADDGAQEDRFGSSVSLCGDTALVAAEGAGDDGGAYVFVRSAAGIWTQQQKLIATGRPAGSGFASVSVWGDTAVVGDPADGAGAVYVFGRTSGSWTERRKLVANDGETGDRFGSGVSVYVDTLTVGAPGDDDAGLSSGSAYLYVRTGNVWAQQSKLAATDGTSNDLFGTAVSVSGTTAIVGAPEALFLPLTPGAAYVFRVGSTSGSARLIAADGASSDHFGARVAVSGDIAVVGAPHDDDGGTSAGAVYVFERVGGLWVQQQKLTANDGAAEDRFGSSVSVDGVVIVVGAPGDDDRGLTAGSAYVFMRGAGGAWVQWPKLTASDGAAGHQFGSAVAISGGTVVIGAFLGDGAVADSGAAYVFANGGFFFVERQKLTASDGASADLFGLAVAVAGDTIVIGALQDDDRGALSGSAYVYRSTAGVWGQQQKLTAADGAAGDWFGDSVAVSGDTLAIGAPQDDDGGANTGSVYVYRRTAGVWALQQKLTAIDRAADDLFGRSTSLSANAVLVGAPFDDDGATNAGSAYVFMRNGSGWVQERKLTAAVAGVFHNFGASVALSGTKALVGAPSDDGCVAGTGAAYVFRLLCTTTPYGAGCGGATLSAVPDFTTPGMHVLSLRDPGTIAIAAIAFGDQRVSLPFPPSCTVLNNVLFSLPASINPFDPNLATLRFRPPAIPGIVFQVQGVVGLTNGWLDLSNGIEFICP